MFEHRGAVGCLALLAMLGMAGRLRAADKSGVSPDRVRLPKGPGSLEGVGENVDTNLNMGLMSYRVPVVAPTGYPGLTPNLSLVYNSGAGNSELGVGWSLPLSSIERMTARGLPHFTIDDVFVANGSDELVRVSHDGVYRARFEKGFVRYTFMDSMDGADGYFRAEYPDGRIGYFGADQAGKSVDSARLEGASGTFRYNLVDVIDTLGRSLHYEYEKDGAASHVRRISYVFANGKPRYEVLFAYEPRPDPVSDAKPGREVLRGERLAQIQLLSQGEQVRRYALTYESPKTSGGLSRLASVQWFGLNNEGPYPIGFRFEYSAALGESKPEIVKMGGGTGVDFQTQAADLVDLNTDGLPDVVDTSATKHRIFLNELHGSSQGFKAGVTSIAGGLNLVSPSTEMLDLDGDGLSDMVDPPSRQVLWNRGTGDWTPVEAFDGLDIPDPALDANLRPFDYDDDKRIDFLHADPSGSWVYLNQGGGSFIRVDEVDTIGAGFKEDGLQFADMNGDGLQDLVRQATGLLSYRMNLGLGHFSDWIEAVGVADSMNGSQLVDLNGDALADMVLVSGDAVTYAINRDGRSFSDQVSLAASTGLEIPERTPNTAIRFADMNGSGSTDVVWIDQSGTFTYLELFPVRPNLLTRIDNSVGKVITVTYGSSTEHMRRDGGAQSWKYRLPQAMLTVDTVTVRDELSGVEQTQAVHYSNGFFDGMEHQFRGFADVVVDVPGDASGEAATVTHHFDVGASDQYYKGLLLAQETTSAGDPLSSSEFHFRECTLEGLAKTSLPVRFVCPSDTLQTLKERGPKATWITVEEDYDYDGFGNQTLDAKLGVTAVGGGACGVCAAQSSFGEPCGKTCGGDEQYVEGTFVPPDVSGGRWIINKPATRRTRGEAKSSSYAEEVFHYDGEPLRGLDVGKLTRGYLSRVEVRVNQDGTYVDRQRLRYDANGAVVESVDANGHRRTYEYDTDGIGVEAEVVHLEDAGRDEPYVLRMTAQHDSVLDSITRSSSWTRVSASSSSASPMTEYAYDAFNRLTAIAQPGDSLSLPTEEFSYELGSPNSRIVKHARSARDGPADLEEVQCFDGLGRKYQTRTLVSRGRYQISGFQAYDARGNPHLAYRAYAGGSGACDLAPPDGVLSTETLHDASGRPLAVVQSDAGIYGTASTSKIVYEPLRTLSFDAEDAEPSSPHFGTPIVRTVDGLGRTIAEERYLGSAPIRTRVTYDELGNVEGYVDARGNRKIQRYDLLGRVKAVDDPDAGTSTFEYDAQGNLASQTDSRGVETDYAYDEVNRKTAEWQVGAESATRIEYAYDSANDCPDCADIAGLPTDITYPLAGDRSPRGEDTFGYDSRGQAIYFGRTVGGHRYDFGTTYDNDGRVTRTSYPGGLSLEYAHDGVGRLTAVSQYVPSITLNDSGLTESLTFGNGVVTTYGYDDLQRGSSLETVGTDGTALQSYRFERDRVGNILALRDDAAPLELPSANARYDYDDLYRVTSAHLDSERPAAETLSFVYDELDGIVSKASSLGPASPEHVGAYHYAENGAGPHAVTSTAKLALAYDKAGQLTRLDGAQGSDQYNWDFMGRLTGAERAGHSLASFGYGSGRDRIKKVEGSHTTYYLTPDFEVRDAVATLYVRVGARRVARLTIPDFGGTILPDLAPLSSAGKVTTPRPDGVVNVADAWVAQATLQGVFKLAADSTKQLDDAIVDELLAASVGRASVRRAPLEVVYLHDDNLGNVPLATDADGKVIERQQHYPHGTLRNGVGGAMESYSFTGKEQDQSTGLFYFGARYQLPALGRFVTPDPLFAVLALSKDGGVNLEALGRYTFVSNNFANLSDPLGLFSWSDAGTRALGVLQVVGSVGEVSLAAAALVAPEPTGATKVLGVVLLLHGLDNIQAGARTALTGSPSATLLETGVAAGAEAAGASPGAAHIIGAGANAVVGLASTVGVARGLAAEVAPTALRFSQTTASTNFSAEGTFAGKTIGSLADELRAGTVAASEVPVGIVNLGSNALIVNTRSALALTRAGIPQSSWNLVNMTATNGAAIEARLAANCLTAEGTATLRITGLGQSASALW